MKLIKPSVECLYISDKPLELIERAGRTCYKSEDKISEGSAEKFVKMLVQRGHEAMIEHSTATYRVICDRGVTHEIVRHRLFSYAQESTRYCNYANKEIEFIEPNFWKDKPVNYQSWFDHMKECELVYDELIRNGATPQEARSVLPNSLKTEIVITGNFREWRHFFKLRTSKAAHPQMREIANMMLDDIRKRVPVIFDDIGELSTEPQTKGTKEIVNEIKNKNSLVQSTLS